MYYGQWCELCGSYSAIWCNFSGRQICNLHKHNDCHVSVLPLNPVKPCRVTSLSQARGRKTPMNASSNATRRMINRTICICRVYIQVEQTNLTTLSISALSVCLSVCLFVFLLLTLDSQSRPISAIPSKSSSVPSPMIRMVLTSLIPGMEES